jgi:hypothetical protein
VRTAVGRFQFNTDTGSPQFWRYAACERVSLDASQGFVQRKLGAVISGPEGHYAIRLDPVERPRTGCLPMVLLALTAALAWCAAG